MPLLGYGGYPFFGLIVFTYAALALWVLGKITGDEEIVGKANYTADRTDKSPPLAAGRNAGAASIAQASDAHEAKMARFSLRVRSGSFTTSEGWLNAWAG